MREFKKKKKKRQTYKPSDKKPKWTNLLLLVSPPVSQFSALHISLGPFMLVSFAETGDATMGRTHCDDSQ